MPTTERVTKMLQRLRKAKDDGFTLIELLIVIIILGILAAIVVFAVGSTRKDAVNSACKTDVKSIQLAVEAIKTKSGSYPALQADILSKSTGVGSTNGAVLKAWPGGTVIASGTAAGTSTDDVAFKYTKTTGGYSLVVAGKNLTSQGTPSGTLDQDADDSAVETACTSS